MRTAAAVLRCTLVFLLTLFCCTPTVSGSEPVTLWRTPLHGNHVCALTGRQLTLPAGSTSPIRVWAGIITLPDGGPAADRLRERHQQELNQLRMVWNRDLSDHPDAAQEIASRLRHARQFRPQYFDVVIAQTPQELRWLIDDDLDGILTDRGSVNPDASKVPPHQWLRMQFRTNGTTAHIQKAGLPDVPPPPQRRPLSPTDQLSNDPVSSLTAKLQELDHPSVRKQHLQEVVAIADQLIQQIDASENPDTPALTDVLYRKGRALGYQELPDVVAVTPIQDQAALDEDFEATFQRLQQLVDVTQPNYILLAIRRERRRGNRGAALDLLELYQQRHPQPLWHHKKRSDLLRELTLTLPAHQAAAELWLSGKRPHKPVPIVFRSTGHNTTTTLKISWTPQPPWRLDALQLQPCSESESEGVAWLPVHQTFKVQSPSSEPQSFTVNSDFVRTGATFTLP